MSAERKALAAAFLAYGVGDKQACLHLLDAVSASYTEKDGPVCLVLEKPAFQKDVRNAWNFHKKRLGDPLLKRHTAFELPWFMAALTLARRKGVLASSQFLWVRPVDRPLWYALHQCGGRAAWAEAFASWAHYAAEEKAKKALAEPHIAQAVRRALLARGATALDAALARIGPWSIGALLATLVLLFAFQGQAILNQPLVIALLAVPILIQVFFNAGLAYWLNRAVGEKHSVACPSALIGASNFFELAVAAAISLFGFHSGAALATVVGVLIEVPVMLLVVHIVNRSKGWYERTA
mgnify:CR=1 FL=1